MNTITIPTTGLVSITAENYMRVQYEMTKDREKFIFYLVDYLTKVLSEDERNELAQRISD